MDSMVNHYTASRRLRSVMHILLAVKPASDPIIPTIVYTKILKEIFPDVPVVIGGIEASIEKVTQL